MSIALNHTIVWCRDQQRLGRRSSPSSSGSPRAVHWGPFMIVDVANGVSLDYHEIDGEIDIASQHYAFLVSEDEFDAIFGRIVERGHGALGRPGASSDAGAINHDDGGRGVYFEDPDGHLLEIITRPYGSGD